MNPGPPCPACGWTLRWYTEQRQWGCDRCRVMRSPQQGSPRKVVIGAGLLATIGAGVGLGILTTSKDAAEPQPVASIPDAARVASADARRAEPPAPPPPPAVEAKLGTPERLDVGDLWLWPRSDGSFVVTSPTFDVTFPRRPSVKLERSTTKTADGKSFDIYTLSDDLEGRGVLQFQLLSLGRNARDVGDAVASLEKLLARFGAVTRTRREEGAQPVVRLETTETSSGTLARIDSRIDLPRGLFTNATAMCVAGDRAAADRFLASVHLRAGPDPVADPKAIPKVTVKKKGKQFVVGDARDSFQIAVPWNAQVKRLPVTKNHVETTVTAKRQRAVVAISIAEMASWDALGLTPAKLAEIDAQAKAELEQMTGATARLGSIKLAGLAATRVDLVGKVKQKVQLRTVVHHHQHRVYRIMCIATPCDPVVKTLRFADPVPVR